MSEKKVKRVGAPRTLWFKSVLYPDCPEHYKFVNDILPLLGLKYFGILHDKDVFPDDVKDDNGNVINCAGELKKPHWHIVYRLSCPKTLSSFCSCLSSYGIEENYIRVSDGFGAAVYITHQAYEEGEEGKHIYPETDIFGDVSLYRYTVSNEHVTFEDFIDFLDSLQFYGVDLLNAWRLAGEAGLYDFISKRSAFSNLLTEVVRHNDNNYNPYARSIHWSRDWKEEQKEVERALGPRLSSGADDLERSTEFFAGSDEMIYAARELDARNIKERHYNEQSTKVFRMLNDIQQKRKNNINGGIL